MTDETPAPRGNPNWQPGKSGNPGGRPKSKLWRDALLAEGEKIESVTERTRLQALAKACFDAGIEDRDVSAMREIAERLEGKVPQGQIVNGDEDGGPVVHRHILGFKSDI